MVGIHENFLVSTSTLCFDRNSLYYSFVLAKLPSTIVLGLNYLQPVRWSLELVAEKFVKL